MEPSAYTRERELAQNARSRPLSPSTLRLYLAAKRLLDFFGALGGLMLLFPLFALLAVLVRISSPGPIFHRRRVLARQGYLNDEQRLKTFDAFKFRTMIIDADRYLEERPELLKEFIENGFKLKNDPRITKIGEFLRRSSLDELPQLFNIMVGQMSLVGPRMITPPELAMYDTDENMRRLLSVPPGLTGYWQVNGRQDVHYTERVRLDMEYVETRSFWLDVEILLKTIVSVLRREGAY
jgi:lipopolysaccharide/colanic/teichoic acid biosynthesis glycosyltransferase